MRPRAGKDGDGAGALAGLQFDERGRALPPVGIGQAKDQGGRDAGMALQGIFHLAGVDILAAADDEVGAALQAHLLEMQAHARTARGLAAAQPAALQRRLAAAVEALDTSVAEERPAQAIALLAAKADVREALDRPDPHLEAAAALLASGEAVGRRLDFRCQEIHRKANTLGAKSADLALTRAVLDLKAALEAFREQARNVE